MTLGTAVKALGIALCVALLGGGAGSLRAQNEATTAGQDRTDQNAVATELSSPRATVTAFLDAAAEGDWESAAACLDLPALVREASTVAMQLYYVLEALEQPDDLPDAGDSALQGRTSYRYFPRSEHIWLRDQVQQQIVLTRTQDGQWLFSEDTCRDAGDLYDRFRDLGLIRPEAVAFGSALWIENTLPDSLTDPENKVLGLKYWQWLGMLLLILIGVALDFTVRGLLSAIARIVIRRKGGKAQPETLRKTVRPFGLFTAGIFWLVSIHLLALPTTALQFLLPAVKLFAMLASVWAAYRLTDLLSEVLASRAERTHTKVDDLLVPLVRKTVKIFIVAVGLIYIADAFEIEILPLLTGLGIGSLAFAFAAKDTIENFFGSIAVIADRPFEVGDWVKIGDVEGIVEELGFRSTRVRTFYNSLMTVPNATLVRATVDNYGRRKYRRWTTHLNITYDTPPDTITAFCEGIRELIRLHPYTRKDYYQVWLHQFGPHSLDILVYVFHEAPDWQTELRERERLMLDIIRLARQLGVEFAFPTQTIHMFREEHPEGAYQPPEKPEGDPTPQAEHDGRLAARTFTEEFAWRREKPAPHQIISQPRQAGDDDDEDTQIESRVGGDA